MLATGDFAEALESIDRLLPLKRPSGRLLPKGVARGRPPGKSLLEVS
jgi:hypothetical protein